jgi:hypothetical protein
MNNLFILLSWTLLYYQRGRKKEVRGVGCDYVKKKKRSRCIRMKSVVDHLWNLSVDDDICCPERAVSKRDERLREGDWLCEETARWSLCVCVKSFLSVDDIFYNCFPFLLFEKIVVKSKALKTTMHMSYNWNLNILTLFGKLWKKYFKIWGFGLWFSNLKHLLL